LKFFAGQFPTIVTDSDYFGSRPANFTPSKDTWVSRVSNKAGNRRR
jgi:hypothetical protein